MWDSLPAEVQDLILSHARVDNEACVVACLLDVDDVAHTTTPRPVVRCKGYWNAQRTAVACTLDVAALPRVNDLFEYIDPSAGFDDRLHLASDGQLVMPGEPVPWPWDSSELFIRGWHTVGTLQRVVHKPYGAFHGVTKATTPMVVTNYVVKTELMLTEQELRAMQARSDEEIAHDYGRYIMDNYSDFDDPPWASSLGG